MSTRRRTLPLLLLLAALIVTVAVIVSVTATADGAAAEEGEIEDFSYQTLSALDLKNDATTTVRFAFTIGKLSYNEVGFVVSKSNSTPTIGGANCYKAGTQTVYSTITEDGTPRTADPGRYWVAVKLTNIPHSYFDSPLYVRAFVTDGNGTRYSDVGAFTICSAKGHTHEIRESEYEMIGGTAAMNVVGTKIGHCSGCNLDNVTQYDATTSLEYKKWSKNQTSSWIDERQFSDILRGGKHFYPDASNDYEGNDLYAEFSILWNETLLNFSGSAGDGGCFETVFASGKTNATTYSNPRLIAFCALTENADLSASTFAGAFEYPCTQIQTSGTGNPYPNMIHDGGAYSDYPNLGGADPDHPEYGWHRIGIKYHEDVINLDAVESSGADAQYKLTVTVYIDGQVVSILNSETVSWTNSSVYKLYKVEKVGDELKYTDINGNYYFLLFKLVDVRAVGGSVYFVDGDSFVTAGHDFVHPVDRINYPAERTETVDGHNFNGAFYYTTVGAHDHVWDDDFTVVKAATLLADGVKVEHCTVCGMDRTAAAEFEHNVQIFTDSSSGSYSPNSAKLSAIRGSQHFYTPGNDLMVEFSILWNDSLTHLQSDNTYKPHMASRFATNSGGTSSPCNIIYWSLADDVDGSDCAFAGGFEWASITGDPGDNPYPRFAGEYDDETAYPNLGGANLGDGKDQGDMRWGWHRVGIRYHEEVTNVDAVKNGNAASYLNEMWVYIDGVLVLHTAETKAISKQLFTATGGGGSITYTENDSYYFHGAFLNSTKMQSDSKGYFEIADYSARIGNTFLQNVRRVNSPTPATLEVESGVYVTSTMWYELDD